MRDVNRPGALRGWAVVSRPNPNAKLRLFCFPYAGGGATTVAAWPRELPGEIEVVAVQPPGREARLAEEPFSRLDALVDAMARELAPLFDKPFAFFGHSNGALMAFELARKLRRDGRRMPAAVIVSGRPAPQIVLTEPVIHDLPDAEFIQELRRFAGTPEELLANKELMALLMPLLRADFALGETYRFIPEPPLDVPFAAFGGERDAEVTPAHVEAWREQAAGEFTYTMFPGDHFFVNGDRELVLQELTRILRPVLASLGTTPAYAR